MEARTVSEVIADIHRWRDALSSLSPARTEEEAIDRITALEELNAVSAAAQARETLTFDMHRRNREAEDGVSSSKQGRGLGAEIGLARRVSRARGSKLLGFSRTLIMDLPHTFASLKSGQISEEKARVVAKEVAWLPRDKRQQVDERMAERLAEVGIGRLGNEVRALAQRLDQQAAVKHLDKCREERAVSVRPAPGNLAYLTALLPLSQAVAVYSNLSKSAQTLIGTGQSEGRTQSQVMADLLVERATGQEGAEAIPTEVHVVMNENSLFEPGDVPAWFPGFGPIPAESARRFVAENEAEVFLRRLYTRPSDGQLVRMDSKRREFSGLLRRMVVIRDDVCRSPWCDAQIKHADHAESYAAGGATGWDNASGLCAACNFVKELSGWRHEASPEALVVRTPTGHRYEIATKPIGAIEESSPEFASDAGSNPDEDNQTHANAAGLEETNSAGPPEPSSTGPPESDSTGPPGSDSTRPPASMSTEPSDSGTSGPPPGDSEEPSESDDPSAPYSLCVQIPAPRRLSVSTARWSSDRTGARTCTGEDEWLRGDASPSSIEQSLMDDLAKFLSPA